MPEAACAGGPRKQDDSVLRYTSSFFAYTNRCHTATSRYNKARQPRFVRAQPVFLLCTGLHVSNVRTYSCPGRCEYLILDRSPHHTSAYTSLKTLPCQVITEPSHRAVESLLHRRGKTSACPELQGVPLSSNSIAAGGKLKLRISTDKQRPNNGDYKCFNNTQLAGYDITSHHITMRTQLWLELNLYSLCPAFLRVPAICITSPKRDVHSQINMEHASTAHTPAKGVSRAPINHRQDCRRLPHATYFLSRACLSQSHAHMLPDAFHYSHAARHVPRAPSSPDTSCLLYTSPSPRD